MWLLFSDFPRRILLTLHDFKVLNLQHCVLIVRLDIQLWYVFVFAYCTQCSSSPLLVPFGYSAGCRGSSDVSQLSDYFIGFSQNRPLLLPLTILSPAAINFRKNRKVRWDTLWLAMSFNNAVCYECLHMGSKYYSTLLWTCIAWDAYSSNFANSPCLLAI